MIKVLDLFSGCGGLSLGIENAGLCIIAAVDANPHAVKTYKANFSSEFPVFKRDLWVFGPTQLEKIIKPQVVDVIVGGPPCQGFSTARQRDGSNNGVRLVEDKRRYLFKRFLSYVRHFQPKLFVMENVRGIRTAKDGVIFDEIIKNSNALGYTINEELMRSWQFGVPQKRIRQIFIGVREDLPNFSINKWIVPTYADTEEEATSRLKEPVTLWEAIGDLPQLGAGEEKGAYDLSRRERQLFRYGGRYIKRVLEVHKADELTAHLARPHSKRDLRDFDKLREGENSAHAIQRGVRMEFPYDRETFKDRYTRQHRHRLSSTIVAHLSKDGLMFIHPTQTRSFTPREAARIQSFPDWFKFPVPRTHQYRLIGDAVPPLLGKAIGSGIKNYLEKGCRSEKRQSGNLEVYSRRAYVR